MSTSDELRHQLSDVRSELSKSYELLKRRGELVAAARSQEPPMTWREIAGILGMTEQGLIKAQKAHSARNSPTLQHRKIA